MRASCPENTVSTVGDRGGCQGHPGGHTPLPWGRQAERGAAPSSLVPRIHHWVPARGSAGTSFTLEGEPWERRTVLRGVREWKPRVQASAERALRLPGKRWAAGRCACRRWLLMRRLQRGLSGWLRPACRNAQTHAARFHPQGSPAPGPVPQEVPALPEQRPAGAAGRRLPLRQAPGVGRPVLQLPAALRLPQQQA